MKNMKSLSSATVLIGVLGLAACGGGGGTGGSNDLSSTGPATATGIITGFGSVFVNGVEYETSGATITKDGAPSDESALKVGMVVTVQGTSNGTTGTANSIIYDDELEGVVMENNVAVDNTLNVMGQTVVVDVDTVFESHVAGVNAPADIAVGNIVEVSGYSSGTGIVYATRLEVKASAHNGEEVEVKGRVAELDTAGKTFTIGSLTIDYAGARLDLSGRALANDLYVEVKSTQGISGNRLVAGEVELEDDDGGKRIKGKDGDEVEIKGRVTSVSSDTEFQLNGRTVLINNRTKIKNGPVQDILEGVLLEVEGRLDANGRLVAEEISFEARAEIEMEAYVDSVDAANKTVTVFGRTIQITNSTLINDHAYGQTYVAEFIGSLAAGDRVEVHAYVDTQTQALVATKLERERSGPDTQVELQGPVDQVGANGMLVVAGVNVQTNFPALVGQILEIEGTYSGGTLIATRVELDD